MKTHRLHAAVHVVDEPKSATLYDTASGRAFRLVGGGSSAEGWLGELRTRGVVPGDAPAMSGLLHRLTAGGFVVAADGALPGEASPRVEVRYSVPDIEGTGAVDDLQRQREVHVDAATIAQQRTLSRALRGTFDGAGPLEWRRVTVDVGAAPIDDELLAAAEDFPVRLSVQGGDRGRRLIERRSAADICEIVSLDSTAIDGDDRLLQLQDLAGEVRSVALQLRPVPGDATTAPGVEEAWRRFFARLTDRVADVELDGGATVSSLCFWQHAHLLPWESPLRRGWDLELIAKVRRWESSMRNPARLSRWDRVYAGFAETLRQRLRLPPLARIADVGGGTGFGALALQRAGVVGPFRATVFDMDHVATTSARLRGEGHLHVRTADALRLPIGDAAFDAVIVVGAIDSFLAPERLRALFVECRRVLRPGGRIAIVHPQLWGTSSAELFVHVNHPELIRSLESALPEAGFLVEDRVLHGEVVGPGAIGSTRLVHLPTNAGDQNEAVFDSAPVSLYLVARRG